MTDRYAALTLDEQNDRGPRGRSHFHGSLRRNAYLFTGMDGPVRSRSDFAAAAFFCAIEPKMPDPYIARHQRVLSATPTRDPNGLYALRIEIAIDPHQSTIDHLPPAYRERGWQNDPYTGDYYPPGFHDLPASFTHQTLTIPMPDELLPDPVYTLDGPALQPARDAVHILAGHASALLRSHLLALDPDQPA